MISFTPGFSGEEQGSPDWSALLLLFLAIIGL